MWYYFPVSGKSWLLVTRPVWWLRHWTGHFKKGNAMFYIHDKSGGLDDYLKEKNFVEEQKQKQQFVDSVKEIAQSAKSQADLAEKNSKSASRKSTWSFWISVLSVALSILINADKIADNLQRIISYLCSVLSSL